MDHLLHSGELISRLFSNCEDDFGPIVISDSDLSNKPLITFIVANRSSFRN